MNHRSMQVIQITNEQLYVISVLFFCSNDKCFKIKTTTIVLNNDNFIDVCYTTTTTKKQNFYFKHTAAGSAINIPMRSLYISTTLEFTCQSVDCIDCCDDKSSSSFFFFLNFVLIFFSVIFPQIGESVGPKLGLLFVTQSTFAKSDSFFNFFTGFKHAAVATIPPVLNLLCDLFGVFFDLV